VAMKIADTVKKEWTPNGRFLEQDQEGFFREVADDKALTLLCRALSKRVGGSGSKGGSRDSSDAVTGTAVVSSENPSSLLKPSKAASSAKKDDNITVIKFGPRAQEHSGPNPRVPHPHDVLVGKGTISRVPRVVVLNSDALWGSSSSSVSFVSLHRRCRL